MGYLKYAGSALVVLALIFAGFKVATWRADALQLAEAKTVAENARIELRHQIERTAKSDEDRLALQEKLTAAQDLLAKKLGSTLNAIKDHAPTSPLCDIPDDTAGQLSKLRQAN